jgi:hypothetical protein
MTMPEQPPGQATQERRSWIDRRRDKIVEEVQRNRRGEYTVPTWALAVALAAMIATVAALIIFAN